MTQSEGEDLADWIAATGKDPTTVFVSHGHGDHFFGAAPVPGRFPEAGMVATPTAAEGMSKQLGPAWLAGPDAVEALRPIPAISRRPFATCEASRPRPNA
jgi:glyoxylase-like metal-dependent hydrolase (beta-lactamase superfamily II)